MQIKEINGVPEMWSEVEEFPNYRISNYGNVYSAKSNRMLSLKNVTGYKRIKLFNKGNSKDYPVHRLVAKAFIPNPENKPFINHKNSVRHDNFIENLEWCTSFENTMHGLEFGFNAKGETHPQSKLLDSEVAHIRAALKTGVKGKILAKKYNVSEMCISKIKNNKLRVWGSRKPN